MLTDEQTKKLDKALEVKNIVFKKGKFYQGKQARTISEVIIKISELCSAFDLSTDAVREHLHSIEESYSDAKVSVDDFTTVEQAINTFIRDKVQPNYNINGNWTHITNKYGQIPLELNYDAIKNELIVWREEKCQKYSISALQAQLQLFVNMVKEQAAMHIYNKIAYDPSCIDEGNDCLSELYQVWKIKERYEIFETLMKHWMWQVKRKLLDRDVKWHIWINFSGGTGIGKSETVRAMCEDIFEDFYNETSISKLFDETREVQRLSTKYIINMDELAVNAAGLEDDGRIKADQKATLKSILTGKKFDARVYCTQQQTTNRITFSCISSSNNHLYDVVYDETSMRRFFEFNCGLDKGSQSLFKHMNEKIFTKFVALWKSVDENRDNGYWDPYSEVGDEIDRIQKQYYPTKTTVVQWMKEMNVKVTLKKTDKKAADWYKQYAEWCKYCGFSKIKSKISFLEELSHRAGNTELRPVYLETSLLPSSSNTKTASISENTVSKLADIVSGL